MSKIIDTEFIEISIPILRRISGDLPFDIYIKRAENTYTKLFKAGQSTDDGRFDKYEKDKKIQSLFVKKEDYRKYLFFVEKIAKELSTQTDLESADEMVHVIKELTNLTMIEIISNMQIDALSLEHASHTIDACVKILLQDPKSLVRLFRLMSTHPYVLRHSITTSVFALLLAQKVKLESKKSLTTVGLGAFLHDIGMSRLSFDAESKSDLTPEEWKEVKEHPQIGSQLLDALKAITPEVRSIVLQHHEQPNGMGYPNGLHDKDIFYLAKIVGIADNFSALLSVRPFRQQAFTPLQAIEKMHEDRGKFDITLLDHFSKIFVKIK